MKLKYAVIIVVLSFLTLFVSPTSSFAALAINREALDAINYENEVVKTANTLINFYEIGMRLVGPNPLTGNSAIRGMVNVSRFDKLFMSLASRRKKMQDKDTELWTNILKADEDTALVYLNRALDDGGKNVWDTWPKLHVPGGEQDETFIATPTSLNFIVPAYSGVVIASSTRFDSSTQDYLVKGKLFYPILTLAIPLPKKILNNHLRDRIFDNVCSAVPGAKIAADSIVITIFPEMDSMHDLIIRTREMMKNSSSNSSESSVQ